MNIEGMKQYNYNVTGPIIQPHNYDDAIVRLAYGEDNDDIYNTHSSDWEPANDKHEDESKPLFNGFNHFKAESAKTIFE